MLRPDCPLLQEARRVHDESTGFEPPATAGQVDRLVRLCKQHNACCRQGDQLINVQFGRQAEVSVSDPRPLG